MGDPHITIQSVNEYIQRAKLAGIPGWESQGQTEVTLLAQGEYNINFLVRQNDKKWVFRVNMGSQINRQDQIQYEYFALKLIEKSGVTPRAYFVDDSRELLPKGLSVMEYLEGGALDYEKDFRQVAELFASIHSLDIDGASNTLIFEEKPLSMTYDECSNLLPVYFESDLADRDLRNYLQEVLEWAGEARHKECYFIQDPWRCVINTEVNSGNFIANRDSGKLYLVDWEKPLWGDPSQDLSHFCAPMTTLWKTDFRMSDEQKHLFIESYKKNILDTHLKDTIVDRVRLRDPFNYLRGISWSAMAWVNYQTGDHALRNQDTFEKVTSYLNLAFLRELFDPYLTDV